MRRAVLSLLALAALLRADFKLSDWQFRRPVRVVTLQPVCTVSLDRTVFEHAQASLADLRMTRGGREVPYVLETLWGSVEHRELRPETFDQSVVPGSGLQLTLDLGRPTRHNRLRISTSQTNFRTKVRVETSADGRQWAVARSDGYVFDFSQGGRSMSVLTVEYPVSTRRFVRATFFGWMRTDAVTGAWLTDYQERPAFWQTVATAEPVRSEARQTSVLVLDLGAAGLPHSRLRVQTATSLFHRACEIEASANRKDWEYIGQGVIYRVPEAKSLALDFPEQYGRYVRLRIFSGDDQPLAVQRVSFETVERRVKFLPAEAGEYALYYGNPTAKNPTYDLAAVLAGLAPAVESLLPAGPEQRNPAFRPPLPPVKPWSERHPEVLYVTLVAAVLGMGYVTVRFLMGVKRAANS